MTDFEYAKKQFDKDCREKKSIARCSKYAVKISRGTVKTVSDYMSRKEREALNGEVKEYSLGKPMGWSEFRQMPVDIQIAYVKRLQDKYRVPLKEIAGMMGCDKANLRYHLKEVGYVSSVGRGGNHKYDEDGWLEFMEGKEENVKVDNRYFETYKPKEVKKKEPEMIAVDVNKGVSEVIDAGDKNVYGLSLKELAEAVRAFGGHTKIHIEIEV